MTTMLRIGLALALAATYSITFLLILTSGGNSVTITNSQNLSPDQVKAIVASYSAPHQIIPHYGGGSEAASPAAIQSQSQGLKQQGHEDQPFGFKEISKPGSDLVAMHLHQDRDAQTLKLDVGSVNEAPATLKVFDLSGREVLIQETLLIPGQNLLELNLRYVKDGIYFVQIATGDGLQIRKFVKQELAV